MRSQCCSRQCCGQALRSMGEALYVSQLQVAASRLPQHGIAIAGTAAAPSPLTPHPPPLVLAQLPPLAVSAPTHPRFPIQARYPGPALGW